MLKEVIIFPTDTVYGIGASIYDMESINRIYDIKGRNFNKPLAVLCYDIKQIEEFAVITSKDRLLANRFWPGGLTLILKTNQKYFDLTKELTIGVRIPNHKLALELLKKYGPMKTTSVNDSGEEPFNDYETINERYKNIVKDIYENNEEIQKVSSTVIDTLNNYNVLREGNITQLDIINCIKE